MKSALLAVALLAATPGLAQNLSQEPTESIPVVVVEETAGPFPSGLAVVLSLLALVMLASR
jgi:hypothetical protein